MAKTPNAEATASPVERTVYIRDMLLALRKVADGEETRLLATLISMAALEADDIILADSPSNSRFGGRSG